MLPDTIESAQSSDATDKVRVGKLGIIFTTPDPRLRRCSIQWVGHCHTRRAPLVRSASAPGIIRGILWSTADSRAAAGIRLACQGTAKAVALAVTEQSSFSSLMADLKQKFDTKDENSRPKIKLSRRGGVGGRKYRAVMHYWSYVLVRAGRGRLVLSLQGREL